MRTAFNVDRDLLPHLERYRAEHMPNAALGDVCLELIRIALSRTPEAPDARLSEIEEAARQRGERAGLKFVHEKFRAYLQDVFDESKKRTQGL